MLRPKTSHRISRRTQAEPYSGLFVCYPYIRPTSMVGKYMVGSHDSWAVHVT